MAFFVNSTPVISDTLIISVADFPGWETEITNEFTTNSIELETPLTVVPNYIYLAGQELTGMISNDPTLSNSVIPITFTNVDNTNVVTIESSPLVSSGTYFSVGINMNLGDTLIELDSNVWE
jgi:hypothetical protein